MDKSIAKCRNVPPLNLRPTCLKAGAQALGRFAHNLQIPKNSVLRHEISLELSPAVFCVVSDPFKALTNVKKVQYIAVRFHRCLQWACFTQHLVANKPMQRLWLGNVHLSPQQIFEVNNKAAGKPGRMYGTDIHEKIHVAVRSCFAPCD